MPLFTDENQEFFKKLKDLVEHTYAENNNSRVVLIAHSMGAPMGMLFLHGVSQEWKDKYIECMVTLSGAWGGSAKAIKVFAIGKYKLHYTYINLLIVPAKNAMFTQMHIFVVLT